MRRSQYGGDKGNGEDPKSVVGIRCRFFLYIELYFDMNI